jgi:rubrerythrin
LYVDQAVFEDVMLMQQVPERRPVEKQARAYTPSEEATDSATVAPSTVNKTHLKLWFCAQCGYVCFREDAPYICPICKAPKERFAPLLAS